MSEWESFWAYIQADQSVIEQEASVIPLKFTSQDGFRVEIVDGIEIEVPA